MEEYEVEPMSESPAGSEDLDGDALLDILISMRRSLGEERFKDLLSQTETPEEAESPPVMEPEGGVPSKSM